MKQLLPFCGRFRIFWRIKTGILFDLKPRIELRAAPGLQRAKKRWPGITANRITAFRLIPAILGYLAFVFLPSTLDIIIALFLYTLTALLDWLDGAWKRANKESGALGEWLDPLVDKFIVLGWLWGLHRRGVFAWEWFWTMVILEIFSTMIYGLRLDRFAGANWFGGAKKVIQDICVLLGILGAIFCARWALKIACGLSILSSAGKLAESRANALYNRQQNAL